MLCIFLQKLSNIEKLGSNNGSFRAHTLFSSREEAQGKIERNLCLLSKGQSTKEEKINALLYDMRDSTIEKIRAGHIPLQYNNCMINNHSRKVAPAPCKGSFHFSIFLIQLIICISSVFLFFCNFFFLCSS